MTIADADGRQQSLPLRHQGGSRNSAQEHVHGDAAAKLICQDLVSFDGSSDPDRSHETNEAVQHIKA